MEKNEKKKKKNIRVYQELNMNIKTEKKYLKIIGKNIKIIESKFNYLKN